MKKVQLIIIAIVMVLPLLITACGPKPVATEIPQGPKVATSADTAKLAWEEEWEATINAARKERVVNVYSTPSEARFLISSTFRERYGVEAEYVTGIGPLLAEKIDAERRAGLYLADVFHGGAGTITAYLKPKGYFAPLQPILLLPEVKDPHNWVGGKLNWSDKERLILAFAALASTILAINTDLVKPKEITSFRDLLDPKWKGKIMLTDPAIPGIGNNLFYVVSLLMGRDFWKQFVKQEPVILKDNRLQMDWLARGKYAIWLAPNPPMLTEFARAGAPVMVVRPVEGGGMSSGGGNVGLFDKAPHPNAAKLFINWLLSKEGQMVFIKTGYPSGRIDVPPEGIDPLSVVDPNLKYIGTDTEEIRIEILKDIDVAKEIFGPLMK